MAPEWRQQHRQDQKFPPRPQDVSKLHHAFSLSGIRQAPANALRALLRPFVRSALPAHVSSPQTVTATSLSALGTIPIALWYLSCRSICSSTPPEPSRTL